ncbi:MAG: hypothetical protein AAGG01_07410 [Planctomycetota bacterium]
MNHPSPAKALLLLVAVPSLSLAQNAPTLSTGAPPPNQPYPVRQGMQFGSGGDCTLIDFEGVGNQQPIGVVTGPVDVTFGPSWLGVVDADAGGTGNFANEPTADTIAFFLTGLDPIDFSEDVSFVEVSYVASAASVPVTLIGWDGPSGTGNQVVSAIGTTVGTSTDGANCTGDPNGGFCLFDTLSVAGTGIRSVTIVGATANQFGFDNMTFCVNNVGSSFCQSLPNSTGIRGNLVASGSDVVTDNTLRLQAVNLPLNTMGYLINSRSTGMMPVGDGVLCLGPNWGRHDAQMGNSGSTGSVTTALDLTAIPRPTPNAAMAVAGETWYFQFWHRDGASSNFTDAVSVTFQ